MTLTLIPAYGRDYRSKKACLADFHSGKDFLAVGIGGSGYVNSKDLPSGEEVRIRYQRQTQVLLARVSR